MNRNLNKTVRTYVVTVFCWIVVAGPTFAGGGLFHAAFKLAGFVTGTAFKAVPAAVRFSSKAAGVAANTVSGAGNVAERIGGTAVGDGVRIATAPEWGRAALASRALSAAADVMSGTIPPICAADIPLGAAVHLATRRY